MSEFVKECPSCFSEKIQKLPSKFKIVNKEPEQEVKTGAIVKKSINDIREEVRMEKEKLKNSSWSSDE